MLCDVFCQTQQSQSSLQPTLLNTLTSDQSDQKYRFICIPTDFLYAYRFTDDRPKTTDKPT